MWPTKNNNFIRPAQACTKTFALCNIYNEIVYITKCKSLSACLRGPNEIITHTPMEQRTSSRSLAIINHKNTITSSCSNIFRELLQPIIRDNPYLTEDVFQTINNLCAFGHPEEIYTADIEAFYPNTSHDLILDAFKHYHPNRRVERQLLRRLLKFNYTTNSINIFYL